MTRITIFLVAIALIAGSVGCNGNSGGAIEYTLTISSTEGGDSSCVPSIGCTCGEGTGSSGGLPVPEECVCTEGTEVTIVATPDPDYRFIGWTGDVETISNVTADTTTITMNGDCQVTANFVPFSGGSGTKEDPFQITDWYNLYDVRNYLDNHFILVNNLDSTTPGYEELASPTANGGEGWQPIGTFAGTFDGQGYNIRDLFISRPGEMHVGLFGAVGETGVVENLGVVNSSVNGGINVGGLVGANLGIVSNSYTTGNMTASLTCCVGGLIGFTAGIVSNSYSTGTVTGDRCVGGLVGYNGGTDFAATVNNSYSTGTVTGSEWVGGLVGYNANNGTVRNSYSTGIVTGTSSVGGLVGINSGAVTNSFWDTETSGQVTSDGGTGKATAEMQDIDTFSGATWDIVAVDNPSIRNPSYLWNIVDDETYPFFSCEP